MGFEVTDRGRDARPATGRGRTVERERLFASLDRVFDGGVGLVSASAGSGKSTLLRSWANRCAGVRVVWLQVQAEHNDPTRLSEAIAASLGEVRAPGVPHGDIVGMLEREALAGTSLLVVLDDAHLVEEPAAVAVVTRLARDRSVPLSVVVSGRHEGALPWHRLRLQSRVELRDAHLAFEPDEAADLLARRFDVELAGEELASLTEATQGWAAGLCLVGLEARDAPDRIGVRRFGPGRQSGVRSFIESEVLGGLTGEQIRFLEVTSVLERLRPELCDVVVGRSDSAQLLDRFVEMNLFTERVSETPLEYRYHSLFAEFLRSRLDRLGAGAAQSVLATASEWYEEHGMTDAAIASAFESGQVERAERLIRSECGAAIGAGRAATVVRWLRRLPAERIVESPELALVLARTSFSRGDLLMARATAAWAEAQSSKVPPGSRPDLELALLQLHLLIDLGEGSVQGAVRRADLALSRYASLDDADIVEIFGIDQEAVNVYRAVGSMLAGEFTHAAELAEAALTPDRLAHPTKATVLGVGAKALALAWMGDRSAASAALRDGSSVVDGFVGSTGDHLLHHVAAIWLAEDDALSHLAIARSTVSDIPLPIYRALLGLSEANYALTQRHFDEAAAALGRTRQVILAMPDAGILADLADGLQVRVESAAVSGTEEPLHQREIEILQAIAGGASRREVAAALYLSLNTVKTYLRTAYRKLGVADREAAIDRARSMGLISPGPGA